jgi:hypothetical protein
MTRWLGNCLKNSYDVQKADGAASVRELRKRHGCSGTPNKGEVKA